jgi:hypothetical protein
MTNVTQIFYEIEFSGRRPAAAIGARGAPNVGFHFSGELL